MYPSSSVGAGPQRPPSPWHSLREPGLGPSHMLSLLVLCFSCPACYYSKQLQHLSVRVKADSHLALLGHASSVNLLPVKPACQVAAGQPRSQPRPPRLAVRAHTAQHQIWRRP